MCENKIIIIIIIILLLLLLLLLLKRITRSLNNTIHALFIRDIKFKAKGLWHHVQNYKLVIKF